MAVNVKDNAGDTMTLLDFDGKYLPVIRVPGFNQETEIRSMPSWKAREDDILICAYPKSGTHWIWEVVTMLLNGKAERVNAMKESAMLEGTSQDSFNNLPSPRVLNTHILYDDIPPDFHKLNCKIIYLLRNIKDVAVSFYHHHTSLIDYAYQGSWENYVQRFIEGKVDYGSWTDHILHWEKRISENQRDVLLVAYEQMHKDPLLEISKIAQYLDIQADSDLIQNIKELCSFKKMKKDKDPLEDVEEWKNKTPGMYRKGIVGDWKNTFTVAQNELLNSRIESLMNMSTWCKQYNLLPR